jgi:hypothetical protein
MEIAGDNDQRLRMMFDTIQQWQNRVEHPPLTAEAGSSLAADDRALPTLPASHVAYSGLLVAVEHLHLFRTAFANSQLIYPTAYFTILRTALMGAAQAVWVLAGPRQQRVAHALMIAIDDINQRRKLLQDLGTLPTEQQAAADAELRNLATRLDEAEAAATAHGIQLGNITRYTLNMTTVIKQAAQLAFPNNDASSTLIRDRAGFLWRNASGHAHGTPSSRLTLIRTDQVARRPDGSGVGKPDASIENITTVAMNPFSLAKEAWTLYDRRRRP